MSSVAKLSAVTNVSAIESTVTETDAIRSSFRIFYGVFAVTFVYSLVKYVGFSGVSTSDIPLFLVNKALSFASVLMLAFSLVIGPLVRMRALNAKTWMLNRKYVGLIGFGAAAVHSAFFLLMLLNPQFYPKFFLDSGRLTGLAQLAFLSGAIALSVFAVLAMTSLDSVRKTMGGIFWKKTHAHVTGASVLVLFHLAFIGLKGWMTPGKWPVGLPPITLLAFVPLVAVLVFRRILARHENF